MKVVTGILCGTGGFGVTSPIVYATASQSSFETLWRQVIEDSGPIISCGEESSGGNKYKIEIVGAKKNEENMGSNLTLKVSMKKVREDGWKEIWRKGGGISGADVWSEWTLRMNNGGIERIQYSETGRGRSTFMVEKCDFKGGKLETVNIGSAEKDIKPEEMNLKIDNCKGWIFSKKCSVKLSSGSDLNWGTVTVPTVTYYAF